MTDDKSLIPAPTQQTPDYGKRIFWLLLCIAIAIPTWYFTTSYLAETREHEAVQRLKNYLKRQRSKPIKTHRPTPKDLRNLSPFIRNLDEWQQRQKEAEKTATHPIPINGGKHYPPPTALRDFNQAEQERLKRERDQL